MSELVQNQDRIRDEIKYSEFSHAVMLGHCGLHAFPAQLFNDESIIKLRRLDLSYNNISAIPSAISVLANLRELWLQNNPIKLFPVEIQQLKKIELIDISSTKIEFIPNEISNLENIYAIDWRSTPMDKNLQEKHGIETNNIVELKALLNNMNLRGLYEMQLFELLFGEHFLMDADKPNTKSIITDLVQNLSAAFNELSDFKQFSRRGGKYLPPSVEDLAPNTINKAKELYYAMKRDTDRKRMAADVEIKLRGMYFDRIERSEVTALLDSIYEHVKSLEDIQFLVQYATLVLPPNPDTTGEVIWKNILILQHELTMKRKASIDSLCGAVGQLYPEQKPEQVREKVVDIVKIFQMERFATKKELTKMSQLTAECSKVFPPDFASVNTDEVLRLAQQLIFKKGQ